MNDRRVVITGIGVVSSIGSGKDIFWESLKSGRSGIKTIKGFDAATHPVKSAGEIDDSVSSLSDYLESKKQLKVLSRPALYSLAATAMAVKDSGLQIKVMDPKKIGAYLGACYGGEEWRDSLRSYILTAAHEDGDGEKTPVSHLIGTAKIDPMEILKSFPNLITCHVAIAYNIQGPVNTFTSNCVSGSQAIGEAFTAIRDNYADIMVCGGSEAPIRSQFLIDYGWGQAVQLSKNNETPEKACRPFDAKRDGVVLGEGAGILILESLGHAQQRGAGIYAEIAGYGQFFDYKKNGDGLKTSMQKVLHMSKTGEGDVDYIKAEGNSTPLWDKTETYAIKAVFGSRAHHIPVSSIKSMTGHSLSAAGGIESIASVLAIQNNLCPPTINYENADPECDLDYVTNKAREAEIDTVIANFTGWFGESSSLLIKRFTE